MLGRGQRDVGEEMEREAGSSQTVRQMLYEAKRERVGHFYAPCLTIGSHIHKNMSMNCELFMTAGRESETVSQINK